MFASKALAGLVGLAAFAGLAQSCLAQQGAQTAQVQGPRAIIGEWSFLCNTPQRVGFAEDTSGKLRRYYIREGAYRADEEPVVSYGEDAGFIKMKFPSGEELTYKRSPEGIREWERRFPGKDALTKDGRAQMPVVKTFIDTPIFQRCK